MHFRRLTFPGNVLNTLAMTITSPVTPMADTIEAPRQVTVSDNAAKRIATLIEMEGDAGLMLRLSVSGGAKRHAGQPREREPVRAAALRRRPRS